MLFQGSNGMSIQRLLFVYLSLIINYVNAFYFYHEGNERKCFSKELTAGSVFYGSYKVQIYDDSLKTYKSPDSSTDLEVIIDVEEIFDGDERIVHQKSGSEGQFTFNTQESGEHRICIKPQSSGWLSKTKAKIDLEMSVGSDISLDSKKRHTMESLHGKIDLLISKMAQIKDEQKLMRDREAQFRDLSEAVNSGAMWWTVIQIIILGITCAWQMKHLATFFVKQKVM
ncbi:similar to Saccharomyces cerevisiae YAR002C-A ERP1 Protein that forms a heterotrimeric complex with Erp2p, Emp24p, and Erv25p [Maudiozyma saulgeensis]|uniref:Similar to Saccharomyces cerevisiae YAR002C-A ERP1 Protein that forms a heterotrimeric complex with Erp2p, Emp24p, and Erv25p n=1 Tax=Maudiozyma saulgeensis TaxID=1789683 RepID=A0A1X7RAD6_9SACH|nr:similar to Saccharomyces cerevisiae YAR002C-A ERP1 Protein that forms a heterotrimeric complex with Erp2p, Emp24p, and Erv25p [Kazachstania saulgeensis]